MGATPWMGLIPAVRAQSATPAEELQVKDGFKVELIYSVPKEEQGSWVSMTPDPKGGLTVSDQYGRLYHVDPPPVGQSGEATVRELPVKLGHAQGLLWAFDSLYVMVNGEGVAGRGSGLYRVRDTDGDGELDDVQLLEALAGAGEHGPHAVILSPDKQSLFVVSGNHTRLAEAATKSRIPMNWGEDLLLPRLPDANGHARNIHAPGGWICKVSPDGKEWEVFSMGYRNTYDIAFDKYGELFAYDADMEWDMGLPWYRPTRVCHATSGSEFGWRNGTGKWPPYYPDSLPPVVNIGPGSPTGIVFGYDAKFPARYRDALYILDWTFGTIYAVHLSPDKGASYSADVEQFISGRPLPLTDVVIAKDGAMYFTVGGRRIQSGLYRVTYVGNASTTPANPDALPEAFQARRMLESFHGKRDPRAIEMAWNYLGDSDRFLRYAARIAIESQDVNLWQERALDEKDPEASITVMIALARQGGRDAQPGILRALNAVGFDSLDHAQKLELLRAYALTLIRQGRPEAAAETLANHIDSWYPSPDPYVNRELCRLLVFLRHPNVITKTMDLMENEPDVPISFNTDVLQRNEDYGPVILGMLANQPHQQQTHYVLCLRNLRYGWTLEQREKYFTWFREAYRKRGGASYQGYLKNIKADALANASEAERAALKDITGEDIDYKQTAVEFTPPKGPGREWTVDALAESLDTGLKARDFEDGKNLFYAAQCATCHRFDGVGGATGPDLTSVASRFSPRDLLESIIEPSKTVSDQYQASIITTTDGEEVVGRIVNEADGKLMVITNPLAPDQLQAVDKSEVQSTRPSPISQMPQGLIYAMNKDEVLDLIAYLSSAGNPNSRFFK